MISHQRTDHMQVQSLFLPIYANHSIRVFLFEHVSNASQVLEYVKTQKDAPVPFVLIDPSLCVSLFQVYLTAYKSLEAQSTNTMKSRNISTELLLNMCPSRNIGEAFRLYGLKESSKTVLIVCFDAPQESIAYFQQLIQGELVPAEHIEQRLLELSNRSQIIKTFKLTKSEQLTADTELEQHVLSRLAIRDL
jgi:EKC/KEOPS complex subunit CGI121/TPRKB